MNYEQQMMRAGNRTFQRQANIALIMQTIQRNNEISRVDIARHLGLERSTVTNIVTNLMEYDIVHTLSQGTSTAQGGRRPSFLGINPEAVHILGLEIEIGYYRAVLMNLSGEAVASTEESLDPDQYSCFSDFFFAVYEKAIDAFGKQNSPLVGVGVGLPAPIDQSNGVILQSHTLKIENFNYLEELSPRLQLPLYIENDSNCCALGELWKQNGSGSSNFLYLLTRFFYHHSTIMDRPGIGLGMVIDGNIYYGANYRGGEYYSQYWTGKNGPDYIGLDEDELLQLTEKPELMERFLYYVFGQLSVTFGNFDPEKIYIGGDLQSSFPLVQKVIREQLKDTWLGAEMNLSKLIPSSLGQNEIAFGAAAMVLNKLFTIPQVGAQQDRVNLSWDYIFSRLEK